MNAIYARQSVDRRDSISVESQVECCLREIGDEPYRVYNDKGFSGKNTERPQFQKLVNDIKAGEISRVYVYRIDRISRAIVDFGKIMELFEEYGVEFISYTEKFDTSTPIGKAMLNIIMVFAQLERETIQQRITDNYYSRGEKGFYLGGYAPFGYEKKEIYKDEKKTYCYAVNDGEAEIVKEIYGKYICGESLGAIARYLNERGIVTRKKCAWSGSGVSRILHNPVYVCADAEVYGYLSGRGARMNNPVSDYNGINGCCVYGSRKSRGSSVKFHTYNTDCVTLGAHRGIIPPDIWLNVQRRFDRQVHHSNGGSGSASWLQGLVKCRQCGASCYVKRYDKGKWKYFYCRGKDSGVCNSKMMRVDKIEEAVKEEVLRRLEGLKGIEVTDKNSAEINKLKIMMSEAEQETADIVKRIPSSTEITMRHINCELEKLEIRKNEIREKIEELNKKRNNRDFSIELIIDCWESLDMAVKKNIASAVFDRVEVDGRCIDIY